MKSTLSEEYEEKETDEKKIEKNSKGAVKPSKDSKKTPKTDLVASIEARRYEHKKLMTRLDSRLSELKNLFEKK